jgi:hypothetical protein
MNVYIVCDFVISAMLVILFYVKKFRRDLLVTAGWTL